MIEKPADMNAWDPERLLHIHRKIRACVAHQHPNIQLIDSHIPLERSRPLGVFASSFNPPTLAHEALVHRVLTVRRYRVCLLILDLHHADKPPQGALFEDRIVMAEVAFRDKRCGIGICSHGRFVDKLGALRSLTGLEGEVEFIVGKDTLLRILDPSFYVDPESELRDLFNKSTFIVFSRPGKTVASDLGVQNDMVRAARIVSMSLPQEVRHISSTLVRYRAASAADISGLVSSGVLAFIEGTGLYAKDAQYEKRKVLIQRLVEQGPEGRKAGVP
jgi:nicotinic acid mononucleotide adenylyltransferase